jgi:hypothetical protein
MRCAVVKMMPVLLSSSHFMHTPQHLASGFPSANIDQKITTLGLQILISKQDATTYAPT